MNYCKMFLIIGLSIFATNAISQQNKRLSVSGKPQDEAFCAILGDTRIPDSRCLGEDKKNHTTIIKTKYGVDYSFFIRSTDSVSICKTVDNVQPLLGYLNRKVTPYKETFNNGSCNYRFVFEKKEDLCSQEAKRIFNNIGYDFTLLELTKANNWNYTKASLSEACK